MGHNDRYREIGEELFRDVLDLLAQGKPIALLGPRFSGKSLLLEEMGHRSRRLPEVDRPHIVELDAQDLYKLDAGGLLAHSRNGSDCATTCRRTRRRRCRARWRLCCGTKSWNPIDPFGSL